MSSGLIPCVRCVPTVKFAVLAPAGVRILVAIWTVGQSNAMDVWITCGTDGHGPSDPHTLGEAFDISVKQMTVPTIVKIKRQLEQILGERFTVLYEVPSLPTDPMLIAIAYVNAEATGPHFHIQRKRGTVYPPPHQVAHV